MSSMQFVSLLELIGLRVLVWLGFHHLLGKVPLGNTLLLLMALYSQQLGSVCCSCTSKDKHCSTLCCPAFCADRVDKELFSIDQLVAHLEPIALSPGSTSAPSGEQSRACGSRRCQSRDCSPEGAGCAAWRESYSSRTCSA